MAYIVMACAVMAYAVMASIVMANIGMAYTVMACIGMAAARPAGARRSRPAPPVSLYSFGLCTVVHNTNSRVKSLKWHTSYGILVMAY